jgi:hypothetical protein
MIDHTHHLIFHMNFLISHVVVPLHFVRRPRLRLVCPQQQRRQNQHTTTTTTETTVTTVTVTTAATTKQKQKTTQPTASDSETTAF